jgi:two-component system sensor histidine kinase GlrK
MSKIKLDKLIEEVVTDHRNSILARYIKLDLQLGSMEVYGNQKQLKTVFDNLVSNAVKFTPEEGFIRISLKTEGRLATFYIEDSGPGIEEEDRSRVFSPFFQGKDPERPVVKGSGLGLTISKEYVQNHDGVIRLLPGNKGARFLVTLPLSG